MNLLQLIEASHEADDPPNAAYGGGSFYTQSSGQLSWNAPRNTNCFFYHDTRNRPDQERTLYMDHHKSVITFLLQALKMMDDTELNRFMVKKFIHICRGNGFDYPEFKAIEKSVMAPDNIDEAKIFDVPSSWYKGNSNLVKRVKDACEKEGAKYYRLDAERPNKIRSVNKLGAPHTTVYLTNDKRFICVGYPNEKVQKIRVSPNMKDVVLRTILKCIKDNLDDLWSIRAGDIIHICRSLGYDYPEFKTIEKSLYEAAPAASQFSDMKAESIYLNQGTTHTNYLYFVAVAADDHASGKHVHVTYSNKGVTVRAEHGRRDNDERAADRFIAKNTDRLIEFGKNILKQGIADGLGMYTQYVEIKYGPVSDEEVIEGFKKRFDQNLHKQIGTSIGLSNEIKVLDWLGVKVPSKVAAELKQKAKENDHPKARLMRLLRIPEWTNDAIAKRLLTMVRDQEDTPVQMYSYMRRLNKLGWNDLEVQRAITKSITKPVKEGAEEEPVLTDFSADLDYTTYHVHVYYKGAYIGSADINNERFLSCDSRRFFVKNNRDTIDDFLNNVFVQINILNRPARGEKGITYKSVSQADIDRALLSSIKNKDVDVESMINKIEMHGYKPSEELRSALSKSLGKKL